MNFIKSLALVVVLGCSGCASWVAQLQANPVATLQQDVTYMENAVGLAQTAFGILAASSPAVAAQTSTFDAIVARVQQGMTTAMDSLNAAAAAGQSAPAVNQLVAAARAAFSDLEAFLTSLPGNTTGQAASPEMQEALHAVHSAARL